MRWNGRILEAIEFCKTAVVVYGKDPEKWNDDERKWYLLVEESNGE